MASLGQKLAKVHFSRTSQAWWYMPIAALQEAQLGVPWSEACLGKQNNIKQKGWKCISSGIAFCLDSTRPLVSQPVLCAEVGKLCRVHPDLLHSETYNCPYMYDQSQSHTRYCSASAAPAQKSNEEVANFAEDKQSNYMLLSSLARQTADPSQGEEDGQFCQVYLHQNQCSGQELSTTRATSATEIVATQQNLPSCPSSWPIALDNH